MIRVLEFVRSRKDIMNKLYANSDNYIEHMIKLYIWRYQPEANHWKTEIISFYRNIYRTKGSNKYLSSQDIYKCIFGSYEDVFDEQLSNQVDWLNYSNRELPKVLSINKKDVHMFIREYSLWLSNKLPKEGSIAPSEASDLLDNLLDKYK